MLIWQADRRAARSCHFILIPFAMSLQSKFPNLGLTIFSRMSALAQQTGAINLSQGFPDFPVDTALIDGVTAAM
jgi:hypothetical protein